MFRVNDWDGPLEQEINEWRQLYPTSELNLESVFAYSHRKHFLRLIGSDEYFDHGSRSLVEARRAIQTILTARLPSATPLLYRDFATQLTPNDTVLSFNYDTLLEQALDEIGKPYSLTPEWWLDDRSGERESESSPRFVDLIKLHGSIDWYDRRHYDESRRYFSQLHQEVPDRDPLFGPDRSVPTERLARGEIRGGQGEEILRRLVRVQNHRQHFPFAASWDVVPFLLPPAFDKLLGNDPIRDLWQNMHRTLDAYSVIVVIGYSMPAYDGYAYEAIGRLLIEYQSGGDRTYFGHRRVPVQLVTLASSDPEVLAGIPFLRAESTRIWRSGFDFETLAWIDWGSSEPTAA